MNSMEPFVVKCAEILVFHAKQKVMHKVKMAGLVLFFSVYMD